MHRVAHHHVDGSLNLFRCFSEINEIGRIHCFSHPIGNGVRGQREPDIVQSLVQLGRHVVRAILVADDSNRGSLSVRDHPALIVGFAHERIHPLERALAHTRGLTQPDWRSQDQNVSAEDLLTDHRPLVALTLVGCHARLDGMFGKINDLTPYIMALQLRCDEPKHMTSGGFAPVSSGLECCVQCNGFHVFQSGSASCSHMLWPALCRTTFSGS